MQSVPLTKCTADDLDLVPGHGAVAARCSSEEDGSNADCMWQIKYLLLDLRPNGGSPIPTLQIFPLSHS